ncbi:uncharacterized protein LOC109823384 [Asparagus officinalis]|uniref:uncharacterized protein LOC109823384 n=1 Tax=Asparagus officinalis TaxID=4686 RepID=UPI00098DF69D|nr:uncharacterized protein LOC109823384 [Asparagus officinalis]
MRQRRHGANGCLRFKGVCLDAPPLTLGLRPQLGIRRWNEEARTVGMKICKCRMDCGYYTSFTDENPGRRFYKCQNPNGGCGMWEWFDRPLCNVSSTLFPILRDEILNLRSELKLRDRQIQRVEAEVKDCHVENANFRDQLQVLYDENACSLEEISKLRDESFRLEGLLQLEKRRMMLLKRGSLISLLFVVFLLCIFFGLWTWICNV